MLLFLESYARLLMVLHGLLAGAVVGLLTHYALWVWKPQLEAVPRYRRQAQLFIRWGALLCTLELLLGLLIYPVYRVRVREAHFDRPIDGQVPLHWLSGVFDLKEHGASLLLSLCVALLLGELLRERLRQDQKEGIRGEVPVFIQPLLKGLALLAALLAWMITGLGLWVSSYYGLPTTGMGGLRP